MTWTIEPASGNLINSEGRDTFSRAEFARQDWPLCPACRADRILVDAIDLPDQGSINTRVMPGIWRCPNGCDPSAALGN